MQYEPNPMFSRKYQIKEDRLSDVVRRISYKDKSGYGDIYLMKAYPGVSIWTIDFHMGSVEMKPMEHCRYLKLNYCLSGRCEVRLPIDRYVYVSSGLLSVDMNSPMGRMNLPSGEYVGLEIIIDLKQMEEQYPAAWSECGIHLKETECLKEQMQGSYLARVSSEWDQVARKLAGHVQNADVSAAEYRFWLLWLIWSLKNRQEISTAADSVFLSPGQRAVVMRTEEQITRDLGQRYRITDLASKEGVSAASLKKHFTQIYGKPISEYLKERRVEKAKELLTAGSLSISDVAGEVGYENQGKFGAMFRRETGATPLEYRRLHSNESERKAENHEKTIGYKKW